VLASTGGTMPDELAAHLRHCASCAALAAQLQVGLRLAALREPSAVSTAVREAQVSEALRGLPAMPARPAYATSGWRVGAWAGAVAVGVAISWGLWLRAPTMHVPSGPALLAGQARVGTAVLRVGDAVVSEALLETTTQDGVRVAFADHSELTASPKSRFLIRRGTTPQVRLVAGVLALVVTKQRPEAPLIIDTDEAEVRVVGTQFSVERREDANVSRTVVVVREGRVLVTSHLDGTRTSVGAGESTTIEHREAEAVGADAMENAGRAEAEPRLKRSESSPAVIRSRIQGGQIQEARRLLKSARAVLGMDRHERAELAVVEAELALAERHVELGIARYLAVVASFPKTPQAEESLFAAAQLSVEQQDDPGRAAHLLNQYCQSYPKGRFSDQAQRLLAALRKVAK